MRIAVCVKTVVEPQSRIELDAEGKLRRQQVRTEVNEYDLYASEEAIRLAETHGGEVVLVSLGSEEVVRGLRKGLAMGAASAVHIACEEEELDAAGTAVLLAAALRQQKPDLVLAGVETEDLGGSQVGVLLAEELGMGCATVVVRTEYDGHASTIRVRRELEAGTLAVVDVALPAVLTIQTGINEPRYPSLKGIMTAKRKPLVTFTASELGFTDLPRRRVESLGLALPPPRQGARIIDGSVDHVVDELLQLLGSEEKVL